MRIHIVILHSILTVCLAAYVEIYQASVDFGGNVTLSCNGTDYLDTPFDQIHVHWEALGKDVATYQGGNITIGRGFEDRVSFLSTEEIAQGDFSLVLYNAIITDTDLYECMWEAKRTVAAVDLNVLAPSPSQDMVAQEGETVVLPCYAGIPKVLPFEKLYIQWLQDDEEFLSLRAGKVHTTGDYNLSRTFTYMNDISLGYLHVTIDDVHHSDQGIYQCRYKTVNSQALSDGVPETVSLTVLGPTGESDTEIWTPESSTATRDFLQGESSSELPLPLEALTEPVVVASTPETFNDEVDVEDNVPWIRIGIIASVLVVTVGVLFILMLLGKL